MTDIPTKKLRGFAAMSPEKRTEIARRGGAAVSAERRSFFKDRKLAHTAGAIGGSVSRRGKKDADAS